MLTCMKLLILNLPHKSHCQKNCIILENIENASSKLNETQAAPDLQHAQKTQAAAPFMSGPTRNLTQTCALRSSPTTRICVLAGKANMYLNKRLISSGRCKWHQGHTGWASGFTVLRAGCCCVKMDVMAAVWGPGTSIGLPCRRARRKF